MARATDAVQRIPVDAVSLEGELVVSRSGRVDVASASLDRVRDPTLFVVGGNDRDVLERNERAYTSLHSEKRLEVVPGAGHLFEGPGELEAVVDVAADWFAEHLG